MMRVLIAVGHGGIYSGGAHQALYQLAGLKAAGVEVMAVWGPDAEGDPRGFRRLEQVGIPFEILPIDHRPTVKSLRSFRRIIRDFSPDVLECVKSGAQYHALYGGVGLRRHALIFYRGISRPMDIFQGLKYRLRRVDRVIANSEALKRIMATTGRILEGKIDVVPGEFDPACSEPAAVDASGLRQELSIPEGVPLITQLGNRAPWRGQEVTLEAAARLKADGYRFHLLFSGRETETLLDIVKSLGMEDMVTLSSYRRDPERLLKETTVAVNASTGLESLSGALLNAQAMGIPAVTSALAGSVEIVEDGVTGKVVPVGDPEALARAIAGILDMEPGLREKMGKAAREHVMKIFSSEARTEKRLDAYRRAIEHRHRIIVGVSSRVPT